MNVQIISGRLGGDPKTKDFEGGSLKAFFQVATDDGYYNSDGQKVQKTNWHNVVAWDRLADVAQKYLTKGATVTVRGKSETRAYEPKNRPGEKAYVTELVAQEIFFNNTNASDRPQQPDADAAPDGDDLPF